MNTKDAKSKSEMIAQVCHSAVKKYKELDGDYSILHWDDMAEDERVEWVDSVRDRIENRHLDYPKKVKGITPRHLFLRIVNLLE